MVSYFVDRAVEVDPDDFWAAVSRAELVLTDALSEQRGPHGAVIAYTKASLLPRARDDTQSVSNRLDVYAEVGDPATHLGPIRQLFL